MDEVNAIPVLVGVSTSTNAFAWEYTWEFGPRFFEVPGGLAPHSFEWGQGKDRYRQTFQVKEGAWIFKEGKAVWDHSYPWQFTGSGSLLGNLWARLKWRRWHVSHAEIIGLQVRGGQSSVSNWSRVMVCSSNGTSRNYSSSLSQ